MNILKLFLQKYILSLKSKTTDNLENIMITKIKLNHSLIEFNKKFPKNIKIFVKLILIIILILLINYLKKL